MSLFNLKETEVEHINKLIIDALHFKNGKQVDFNFDKVMVNLFFEPSTRTNYSFEMAAKKLKIQTINFSPQSSSLNKGETFIDTVNTFLSYKPSLMVIRHSEDDYYKQIDTNIPIVNGGDGKKNHPTQSLLDLMTIYEKFNKFEGLTVLICGDIKYSRVARTNYDIMKRLNINVLFSAPDYLKDDYGDYISIDEGLKKCDVVMLLRMQSERHPNKISNEQFNEQYGLNKERLKLLKQDSIIMHPAPFNRGIELTDDVLEDKRCKIFEQSENGVYMRMAVICNEIQ